MKLQNKVAFITGGTSGIGLETAKLFQAEGAKVIVTGTNPGRLEAAGKALGDNALVLSVDLCKPAEIERAVEEVRARYGRIDVVFANAGAGTAAPLESVTMPEIPAETLAKRSPLSPRIIRNMPAISRQRRRRAPTPVGTATFV